MLPELCIQVILFDIDYGHSENGISLNLRIIMEEILCGLV